MAGVNGTGNLGITIINLRYPGLRDLRLRAPRAISSYGIRKVSNLGNVQGIFDSGVQHLSEGRHSEALSCFKGVLQHRPTLQDAWLGKGFSELNLKKDTDAADSFARALSINRDLPEALIGKGLALVGSRMYQKALDCFYFAIQARPRLAGEKDIMFDLGTAWEGWFHSLLFDYSKVDHEQAEKCINEAIKHFQKVMEIAPSDAECMDKLAQAYCKKLYLLVELDRHSEALACFKEAMNATPELSRQIVEQVLVSIKDSSEEFEESHGNEAYAFIDKSVRFLEMALQAVPQDLADPVRECVAQLYYLNAGICVRSEWNKEALECYDKCLSINPKHVDAMAGKASVLGMMDERKEEALKLIEDALAIDPRHATAWYGKGVIKADKKEYDEAIRCFEEAVKHDPDLFMAIYLIEYAAGKKAHANGDNATAVKHLKKYLEAFTEDEESKALVNEIEKGPGPGAQDAGGNV